MVTHINLTCSLIFWPSGFGWVSTKMYIMGSVPIYVKCVKSSLNITCTFKRGSFIKSRWCHIVSFICMCIYCIMFQPVGCVVQNKVVQNNLCSVRLCNFPELRVRSVNYGDVSILIGRRQSRAEKSSVVLNFYTFSRKKTLFICYMN